MSLGSFSAPENEQKRSFASFLNVKELNVNKYPRTNNLPINLELSQFRCIFAPDNSLKQQDMAYNALDIAKKIVCRTDVEHGDSLTNLKLQKLLYFMQGFHLAFFGVPFFNEPIEAWTYGPVVPVVFQEFKKFKKRDISPDSYSDNLVLTADEQQMFDMVYQEYNQFSAVTLMNMTHTEGPWKNHDIGDEISNEEMRDFFLTQIERDDKQN